GTEKPLSTIVVEINKDKKKEAERLAALKELREAAPDLARDVDDQTLDLKTAQKELKQRLEDEAEEKAKEKRAEEAELAHKRQVRQTQKEMEELSKAAPDLAKTVEDDESTLKQAQAVLQQRIEKDKLVDYLEQQKEYDLAEKLRRDELVITQAKELSEERRKRRVKLSWLSDKAPDLHTQVENGEMPLEEACEIADERPQPISYARIMNSWDSAINEARRSLEFLLKTMNEHLEVVSTIDGGVHGDVYRQKTLELQQQCVELTNLWREHTNQRKQFEVI
ncbi:MAG TPA: hypothetical protein VGO21_01935, partial [Candidatus Paceibacterota bacterium]|nr:hypothetical protein [Candidatus Paceibacterota bacterium]